MSGVPSGPGCDDAEKWWFAFVTVFAALAAAFIAALYIGVAYAIGGMTGVFVLVTGAAAFALATAEVRKRI